LYVKDRQFFSVEEKTVLMAAHVVKCKQPNDSLSPVPSLFPSLSLSTSHSPPLSVSLFRQSTPIKLRIPAAVRKLLPRASGLRWSIEYILSRNTQQMLLKEIQTSPTLNTTRVGARARSPSVAIKMPTPRNLLKLVQLLAH
jgi:hypothetical protein